MGTDGWAGDAADPGAAARTKGGDMPTYREIINELLPDRAIAEAERRVYDRQSEVVEGAYECANGLCALGVMMHAAALPHPRRFPVAYSIMGPSAYRADRRSVMRRMALDTIVRANDRGLLATPGSLTRLLDRAMKAVVR